MIVAQTHFDSLFKLWGIEIIVHLICFEDDNVVANALNFFDKMCARPCVHSSCSLTSKTSFL